MRFIKLTSATSRRPWWVNFEHVSSFCQQENGKGTEIAFLPYMEIGNAEDAAETPEQILALLNET